MCLNSCWSLLIIISIVIYDVFWNDNFFSAFSYSDDLEQVTEGFDYLCKVSRYIPKQFVSIFSKYFKKGDKVGLQSGKFWE